MGLIKAQKNRVEEGFSHGQSRQHFDTQIVSII